MGSQDAIWAETFAALARLRARLAHARGDREADLGELAKALDDVSGAAWASYTDLDARVKAIEAATRRT